jgi:broad specificity phosphatase PhoE
VAGAFCVAVTVFYVVQHGEKERLPGDPGLTELGRGQAERTALWLSRAGVTAVFSSPLRRARETADAIASVVGAPVREDGRLRERMNWDGSQPFENLLADWAACDRDRHFVPRSGDSSWQAGERFCSFLRMPPRSLA